MKRVLKSIGFGLTIGAAALCVIAGVGLFASHEVSFERLVLLSALTLAVSVGFGYWAEA